jgi:hypothetical protein
MLNYGHYSAGHLNFEVHKYEQKGGMFYNVCIIIIKS